MHWTYFACVFCFSSADDVVFLNEFSFITVTFQRICFIMTSSELGKEKLLYTRKPSRNMRNDFGVTCTSLQVHVLCVGTKCVLQNDLLGFRFFPAGALRCYVTKTSWLSIPELASHMVVFQAIRCARNLKKVLWNRCPLKATTWKAIPELILSFLSFQMSKVSWYKQRLRALLFKARFADKVEEIKPVRCCDIRYCVGSYVCLYFFVSLLLNDRVVFRTWKRFLMLQRNSEKVPSCKRYLRCVLRLICINEFVCKRHSLHQLITGKWVILGLNKIFPPNNSKSSFRLPETL